MPQRPVRCAGQSCQVQETWSADGGWGGGRGSGVENGRQRMFLGEDRQEQDVGLGPGTFADPSPISWAALSSVRLLISVQFNLLRWFRF